MTVGTGKQNIPSHGDAENPADWKSGLAIVSVLWAAGTLLLGGRWVLFLFSAADETASPQYMTVSYLMPWFVFMAIPMGMIVYLSVKRDRRMGKEPKAKRIVAFWIVLALPFYFFWWITVPFSLGRSLFLMDTGVITIPLALSLTLSTIALRITSKSRAPLT